MGEEGKKEAKGSPERGEKESPEERFKRLASLRTQNALKRIKLIGNLSGTGYRYTDEQVDKILSALRSAVDEAEARFRKQEKRESKFTL